DDGAVAVLRIGDVALRREAPAGRHVYDLGEVWTAWTGLPFAFAVWQVRAEVDGTRELATLHEALLDSRSWFGDHDERLQQGALHYYALAASLDEAAPLGALPW